jgi:hypothetical protein
VLLRAFLLDQAGSRPAEEHINMVEARGGLHRHVAL